MECATWIFNKLLTRAANTPRNFILDQTNVYKNARIRKLRPFANYRKVSCKRERNDTFLYGGWISKILALDWLIRCVMPHTLACNRLLWSCSHHQVNWNPGQQSDSMRWERKCQLKLLTKWQVPGHMHIFILLFVQLHLFSVSTSITYQLPYIPFFSQFCLATLKGHAWFKGAFWRGSIYSNFGISKLHFLTTPKCLLVHCALNIFQVIFTELSRDEAQRNLDEMQRVLPRTGTPSYGNSSNKNVWHLYCYLK